MERKTGGEKDDLLKLGYSEKVTKLWRNLTYDFDVTKKGLYKHLNNEEDFAKFLCPSQKI